MYLYAYGVESDYFVIILDGNAELKVGRDGMEVNAGLFSYYGVNALFNDDSIKDAKSLLCSNTIELTTKSNTNLNNFIHATNSSLLAYNSNLKYVPEFSLKVNSYCVYMKITRADWLDLVKKSLVKKTFETSKIQNEN